MMVQLSAIWQDDAMLTVYRPYRASELHGGLERAGRGLAVQGHHRRCTGYEGDAAKTAGGLNLRIAEAMPCRADVPNGGGP